MRTCVREAEPHVARVIVGALTGRNRTARQTTR